MSQMFGDGNKSEDAVEASRALSGIQLAVMQMYPSSAIGLFK